jgi:hypothetical protein
MLFDDEYIFKSGFSLDSCCFSAPYNQINTFYEEEECAARREGRMSLRVIRLIRNTEKEVL